MKGSTSLMQLIPSLHPLPADAATRCSLTVLPSASPHECAVVKSHSPTISSKLRLSSRKTPAPELAAKYMLVPYWNAAPKPLKPRELPVGGVIPCQSNRVLANA